MKNTHLEHPEDSLLLSKEIALNTLKFLNEYFNSTITVKWDGSPALVFGTCPETNQFFVGTKSVFNKKKIKINYSHSDIDKNHEGEVADILHAAYDNLPKIDGIVQGDFIGFGGKDFYKSNVIEYVFSKELIQKIIIACHTSYSGPSLKDSIASFNVPNLTSDHTLFLSPNAYFTSSDRRINMLCHFANMVVNFVEFPSEKRGQEIKVIINKFIRQGQKLDSKTLSKETNHDVKFFLLYNLIIKIKEHIIDIASAEENVECYIGNDETNHEGFVMTNKYGTYKLVDRYVFSHANFSQQRTFPNK